MSTDTANDHPPRIGIPQEGRAAPQHGARGADALARHGFATSVNPGASGAVLAINFPLPPTECWPNRQRVHWRSRYGAQQTAREWGVLAGIAAIGSVHAAPHWRRCGVAILFRWPDARKRDLDGALGACKAYMDALIDVGIYADDSAIATVTLSAVIDRANSGVTFTIWEVEA